MYSSVKKYYFCKQIQHLFRTALTNTFTSSLFQLPQHHLGLAALAAHNKNSSIADLRLKAKKHAEALGLPTENSVN